MDEKGRTIVGDLPGLRRIHGTKLRLICDFRLATQSQIDQARATVAREQRRAGSKVRRIAGSITTTSWTTSESCATLIGLITCIVEIELLDEALNLLP